MLFVIIGRTSTGKDVLMNILRDRGFEVVKSYTTRPRRYDGEDTHLFITDEQSLAMLEDSAARTVINGYRYLAMPEQVAAADVYNIDPPAIERLCEKTPEVAKAIVHVKADMEKARAAAITRGDDPEREAAVFDARVASEDARFKKFEQQIEDGSIYDTYDIQVVIEADNHYRIGDFDEIAEQICELRQKVSEIGAGGVSCEKDALLMAAIQMGLR